MKGEKTPYIFVRLLPVFCANWSGSRDCLPARWSPCRAVTKHAAVSFQALFINSFLIGMEITGLVLQASRRQQGGMGGPLTLFSPAHNGSVCDCVSLYSCQMGLVLLPTKKSQHFPALILFLVCVQSSTCLYCLLASRRAVLTDQNITLFFS